MKVLLAIGVALAIAIAALPLREPIGLDTQRTPVDRWRYLRSEIVNHERRRIDYAFTGSSMTLSAVRPSIIAAHRPGTVVYNFAHFGWGHDADYYVAKPLLERHDVGTLVIELPRSYPLKPHNQTRYLVGAAELGAEIAGAADELTLRPLAELLPAVKARVARLSDYTSTALLSLPRHAIERMLLFFAGGTWEFTGSNAQWELANGYVLAEASLDRKPAFVARQRATPPIMPGEPARVIPGTAVHPEPGSRSERYLQRLRELADANGTRLVFLYVPPWRARPPSREQVAWYRRFGDVLVPDLDKIHAPEHYVDPLHILGPGTEVFSRQVIDLLEGRTRSRYEHFYR